MHIKKCREIVLKLEKMEYFSAILHLYEKKYDDIVNELIEDGKKKDEAKKEAYKIILSHLHDLMREAEGSIEKVINDKISKGKIKDASQTRKSVAGNLFQQLIAYTLAKNIIEKNIDKKVVVSLSANILNEYAVIKVGDDEQKPDSDILVYSVEDETSPIINFSCKTSCRERAGQTYKWKLLSDLATCSCAHKKGNKDCPVNKYGLEYNPKRKVYMCFITADFYDEIKNKQIVAMFNFFDNSYVAKTVSSEKTVKTLQNVIDDINNYY